MKRWIKNFDDLAATENRKLALLVAEEGLEAINTEMVISRSVYLKDDILIIKGQSFDLSNFKKIKVVGFGKASVAAAVALEKILGSRIGQGAVIGLSGANLKYIKTYAGTHP